MPMTYESTLVNDARGKAQQNAVHTQNRRIQRFNINNMQWRAMP